MIMNRIYEYQNFLSL